jgi:uncharacterized protein (UPF0248 family)
MTTIQDLLHRIRWDPKFRRGEFVIGYYDRVERAIIDVSFTEVAFPKDAPGVFELIDREGQTHTIQLHRVRAVYKNGELIWRRD